MRSITKRKIIQEVQNWQHRDLIDHDLAIRICQRYSSDAGIGTLLIRWLGFFALLMLASSLFGFIGMYLGKAGLYISPLVAAGSTYGAWYFGHRLTIDPQQRYPVTGAILITFSLLCAYGTMMLTFAVFGGQKFDIAHPVFVLLTAIPAFAFAYHYATRWPLVIGILLVFHGLGTMHGYGGHGSYFLGTQNEWITLIAGIVAITIGWWHERVFETDYHCRFIGFGHWFIVLGLLFINLSTWFLSLPKGQLVLVGLFTAIALGQIIIGARNHDTRFIGFGIVFMSINFYTRFFEHFWDELSKGVFFLAGGLAALILGLAFEWYAQQQRAAS